MKRTKRPFLFFWTWIFPWNIRKKIEFYKLVQEYKEEARNTLKYRQLQTERKERGETSLPSISEVKNALEEPKEKDWRDLIDTDWPTIEITEKTRQETVACANSGRFSPVPFRIATGRFWTDEEWEKYREKTLKEFEKK